MSTRIEFSAKVRKIAAERVGSLCSNPDCRRYTIGPNLDPTKATRIGEAAHIRAASEDGPRYDPDMTGEERAGIDNAIWLCTICHTLIDNDAGRYPVETLRMWRANAEMHAHSLMGKQPGHGTDHAPGPLVASYNQTGGQTALFIHNEGLKRRTLRGLTIRKDWLEGMKARPVENLVVALYSPDGEAQAFAKDVALFAKDVGWTEEIARPAILWGPLDFTGVHITSKRKDDPGDPLRIFATWLHGSGFDVSFGITPSNNRIHIAPV